MNAPFPTPSVADLAGKLAGLSDNFNATLAARDEQRRKRAAARKAWANSEDTK